MQRFCHSGGSDIITLCGFGVNNFYNKLKLVLLEKQIPFSKRLVYPWERDAFAACSPLGKISFIETEHGGLSESQVILDYLEERFPEHPPYPADSFGCAKCRELIQHLELNAEWVARRLYNEAFFNGQVCDETKREVAERLAIGLDAVARLARFSPFILGDSFTAADCAGYVHFTMIRIATTTTYSTNMLDRHVPGAARYMAMMDDRPHICMMMSQRSDAMSAFIATNVPYDG